MHRNLSVVLIGRALLTTVFAIVGLLGVIYGVYMFIAASGEPHGFIALLSLLVTSSSGIILGTSILISPVGRMRWLGGLLVVLGLIGNSYLAILAN